MVPTDQTPSGGSKKSKEADLEVCLIKLICDVGQLILRDGDDPDDAIYCEGDCQGWLQKKYVSMLCLRNCTLL